MTAIDQHPLADAQVPDVLADRMDREDAVNSAGWRAVEQRYLKDV